MLIIQYQNWRMYNQYGGSLIEKSHNRARLLRQMNRDEIFNRNRNSSYLDSYDSTTRELIKQSLQGDVPYTLPELGPTTISYYRRANRPVFKTREKECEDFQPHMLYESLLMLAAGKDIESFVGFHQIMKEFQEDLPLYLKQKFKEIKEMAIVAAGNKILGKEEDILNIVSMDQDHLWVLINHVYERKVCFTHLFKFLNHKEVEIIYRTIFQMSNNQKDEIIDSIMSHGEVLAQIIMGLQHENKQIQSYTIRIIGNILAEKEQYAYDLKNYNILERLYPLLKSSDTSIRKDVCWTIANYAFEKGPATQIISNSKFLEKLLIMFKTETKLPIKIELYYIFSHLIERASKQQMYKIVLDEGLLQQCQNDLGIQDSELNVLILSMIVKLIELGEYFVVSYDDESVNQIANQIKCSDEFKQCIEEKTYSQNPEISDYSMMIQSKLNLNDD